MSNIPKRRHPLLSKIKDDDAIEIRKKYTDNGGRLRLGAAGGGMVNDEKIRPSVSGTRTLPAMNPFVQINTQGVTMSDAQKQKEMGASFSSLAMIRPVSEQKHKAYEKAPRHITSLQADEMYIARMKSVVDKPSNLNHLFWCNGDTLTASKFGKNVCVFKAPFSVKEVTITAKRTGRSVHCDLSFELLDEDEKPYEGVTYPAVFVPESRESTMKYVLLRRIPNGCPFCIRFYQQGLSNGTYELVANIH
jgi:hypothetical protein